MLLQEVTVIDLDRTLDLVRALLRRDGGFSTAELLGNAALGIAALVAIWAVLQALGLNIVAWIAGQLGVG